MNENYIINDGCSCQGCGQMYKMDVLVPDEIWERIKPIGAAKGGGLLCGKCIISAMEKLGYSTWAMSKVE